MNNMISVISIVEMEELLTPLLRSNGIDFELAQQIASKIKDKPELKKALILENILQLGKNYSERESDWRFSCSSTLLQQVSLQDGKYDIQMLLHNINKVEPIRRRSNVLDIILYQYPQVKISDLEALIDSKNPNRLRYKHDLMPTKYFIVCKALDKSQYIKNESQLNDVLLWCLNNSKCIDIEIISFLLSSYCSDYNFYKKAHTPEFENHLEHYQKLILTIARLDRRSYTTEEKPLLVKKLYELANKDSCTKAYFKGHERKVELGKLFKGKSYID